MKNEIEITTKVIFESGGYSNYPELVKYKMSIGLLHKIAEIQSNCIIKYGLNQARLEVCTTEFELTNDEGFENEDWTAVGDYGFDIFDDSFSFYAINALSPDSEIQTEPLQWLDVFNMFGDE